jgi:hypothetical protein
MSTLAKKLLQLEALPHGALVRHLQREIAHALISYGCGSWRGA